MTTNKSQFEVQTYTLAQGWINCWTEDEKPLRFDTREAAQAEIDATESNERLRIVESDLRPLDQQAQETSSGKIILTVDVIGRYRLEIDAANIEEAQESLSFAWPANVRVLWSDETIDVVET